MEQQALQRIAAWCYQYSHQVCLPTDRPGLILEAGASERLFGKADALASRIESELGRIGYSAATGSAPTIEAAWLAAYDARHVSRRIDIRSQLGPLPLHCLQLEPEACKAMENMGLRQFHELLRLPRKALARRFSPDLPAYLDRLLGLQREPCRHFQPPEAFSARLELPAEATLTQALMFPIKRLLEELCGVLRGSDAAVQEVSISLGHESHSDSVMKLCLQSPSQDMGRLMVVLRERLDRLRLPEAVRDIRLQTPRFLKFTPGQHRLFQDASGERLTGVTQLTERLQARLGGDAVKGITGVEDHRPEYSWRTRPLGEKGYCTALPHRPAWLMARPRRCDIRHYEILSGPERIESGWWDGRDCRRDYFIVSDRRGCRLWAFHEYKPRQGWFLHGIFS
jgi:protein ImuB